VTIGRYWLKVCGRARGWRTIRAIPSEPVLTPEKAEQFFKLYGHEISFLKPANAQQKNRRSGTSLNTTTSYVSQATQPASSASASNPSRAEASYAALNLELSCLSATKHYT